MDALNPELTGLHPFTARVATPSDAAALRQLWNLFCHDLPDITRALPDHAGSYRNDRLNNALASTPGWTAWIIAPAWIRSASRSREHSTSPSPCCVASSSSRPLAVVGWDGGSPNRS